MATPTYSFKPETGYYHLTGHPVVMAHGITLNSTGPFFEYVLTYLCASAGFTPVYDTKQTTFMAGTLGVFPRSNGNTVHVDLSEAVRLARDGTSLPQQRAEQRLCCMLANSAFESIADADRDRLKGQPVFEFFRHVRNAASHNNRWHFFDHEPARPAEWGSFKIDHTLKGSTNPLHDTTTIYGTLHPADLLYLLRDVEPLLIKP